MYSHVVHIHIYTWYMYITYIEDVMYVRLIVHTCAHDVHMYVHIHTVQGGVYIFIL